MLKAIQIIFNPAGTWEKISGVQRGYFWIFFFYLLPMAMITTGAEAYSLARWGQHGGEFGRTYMVSRHTALTYGGTQAVLLMSSVVLAAALLHLIAKNFDQRSTFLQSFTVMAYAFGPIFMVRILDGIPALNTWLALAIGVLVSSSILYHGVGLLLKPDQTKGFGLYVAGILATILTASMSHAVACAVLRGTVRF